MTSPSSTHSEVDGSSSPRVSAEDHAKPDPVRKIMWAEQAAPCLARNWLTEDLIRFSEKHWRCSREQAIERLLAKR